jgi:hypothetical protein
MAWRRGRPDRSPRADSTTRQRYAVTGMVAHAYGMAVREAGSSETE